MEPQVSEFRDFGTSELRDFFRKLSRLLPFQSPELQTFSFSILRAHIVQSSPTKAMARGMPRKVHVTPGDVIRPHHVYPFTSNFGLQKFVRQHIPLLPIVAVLNSPWIIDGPYLSHNQRSRSTSRFLASEVFTSLHFKSFDLRTPKDSRE
jgi:hypothetical protein